MKFNSKHYTLFYILCLTMLSGCNSSNNNTRLNGGVFCSIHNKNCEQIGQDMGMSLDEYHNWQELQLSEIEAEDRIIEYCNTCGYGLEEPINRSCDYCGKNFDGLGYYINGSEYRLECSEIYRGPSKNKKWEEVNENMSETEIAITELANICRPVDCDPEIGVHNKHDWNLKNPIYCSKKCILEYNNFGND